MTISSDARLAWRRSARRPLVPLLVALLFALGIGLASGMWAVVDAALLRPLPYRDGGALVSVLERHPARGRMAVTPANFLDWAPRASHLQDVSGEYTVDVSLTAAGPPERVAGAQVTERFFNLWGVPPALGRAFDASDFATDGRVAVLGDSLWSRQFNRHPGVVGARVRVDGDSYTVIGVMPPGFRTVGHSQLWIPWRMSPDEQRERRFHLIATVARLRDRASVGAAQTELELLYRQLETDHVETTGWERPGRPV